MSELEPTDKRAAVTGMIVTTVLLFLFAFTIVQLTNAKFAKGESHAEATR